MERVEPPDLAAGRRARPVDDRQVAPQRAGQPAPRVRPEVGVVGDPGRDRGVRDLEQQRPRSGAEQEHRLPVQPPGLGGRAVQPGVGRGGGRSFIRPSPARVSIGARYRTRWRDAADEHRDALGHGLRPRPTRPPRDEDVEGLLPPPAGAAVRPARAGDPRTGPRVVAARARGRACSSTRAAAGLRPRDRRLRALRARHRPRLPGAPAARTTSMSRRSPGTSCAGGSSAARSAWPPAPPRATRSPTCTPALYDVPRERVAEAGRLRGMAAEVRDRGATDDPDGPTRTRRGVLARGRPSAPRVVPEPQREPRGRGAPPPERAGSSPRCEPVPGPSGS